MKRSTGPWRLPLETAHPRISRVAEARVLSPRPVLRDTQAGPPWSGFLVAGAGYGYTRGMKTAVSVPDDLFAQADRLAKRSRRSRSEVYSAALREYVARHAPDEVTAGIDAVLADLGDPGPDEFAGRAARRALAAAEW
jgi:predicted transcriptional regulator